MKRPELMPTIYTYRGALGWLPILVFVTIYGYMFVDALSTFKVANASLCLLLSGYIAYLIFIFFRQLTWKRLSKSRASQLSLLAETNGWQKVAVFQAKVLGGSSLPDIAEKGVEYLNTYTTTEWDYTDLKYSVYKETKNGDYKAAEIYYAVISTQLPRKLPNILFDSLKMHKRQFKKLFDRRQEHRLEAGFDRHFMTYFPPQYTIDSLSFITPEVMEVLVAASDYDIEIVDDRLLLYGQVYKPELQINEMVHHIKAIREELIDNIDTYRDERLPYAQGRAAVAPLGMRLKRPPNKLIWGILFMLAMYAISAYMGATGR